MMTDLFARTLADLEAGEDIAAPAGDGFEIDRGRQSVIRRESLDRLAIRVFPVDRFEAAVSFGRGAGENPLGQRVADAESGKDSLPAEGRAQRNQFAGDLVVEAPDVENAGGAEFLGYLRLGDERTSRPEGIAILLRHASESGDPLPFDVESLETVVALGPDSEAGEDDRYPFIAVWNLAVLVLHRAESQREVIDVGEQAHGFRPIFASLGGPNLGGAGPQKEFRVVLGAYPDAVGKRNSWKKRFLIPGRGEPDPLEPFGDESGDLEFAPEARGASS